MLLRLAPRRHEFYTVFDALGLNAHATAVLVQRRFGDLPDRPVQHSAVKELETEGDRLTARLYELMNTQYITPFDREDIGDLARAVDDVVDYLDQSSELLDLYRIEVSLRRANTQCRLLVDATGHLAAALSGLRSLSGLQPHLAAINACEDEGDRVVRNAIAALFADDTTPSTVIIKRKDIYTALEDALDACDTAGHRIGNIVVKNA